MTEPDSSEKAEDNEESTRKLDGCPRPLERFPPLEEPRAGWENISTVSVDTNLETPPIMPYPHSAKSLLNAEENRIPCHFSDHYK